MKVYFLMSIWFKRKMVGAGLSRDCVEAAPSNRGINPLLQSLKPETPISS
jgi:hypothetical protein